MMRIQQTDVANVTVCTVTCSRVTADVAPSLKASLLASFRVRDSKVILDLSGVSFIDSSGLSALVSALKAVTGEGDLVLCGVSGQVATMLKLTRMNQVFRIFANAEEAASMLGASQEAER